MCGRSEAGTYSDLLKPKVEANGGRERADVVPALSGDEDEVTRRKQYIEWCRVDKIWKAIEIGMLDVHSAEIALRVAAGGTRAIHPRRVRLEVQANEFVPGNLRGMNSKC